MARQQRSRGDSLLDESENPPKRQRQEHAGADAAAATLLAQIHALSDMSSFDVKSDPGKMYATLDLIRAHLDSFERTRSSDVESKNSSMMVESRETSTATSLSLPSNESTRDDEEDEGVLSPLFPIPFVGPAGSALRMVPVPELIHRARQVSPTWRNFLRPDNKRFWKDVAMNNYSSVLSDTAVFSGMSKEEQQQFNFYNFVAGMAQKPNLPPPVPEHRLRIEDLVLVVEIYHTRDGNLEVHEKIGTFCSTDCSPWLRDDVGSDYALRLEQDKEDPLILDVLNPLSRKAESLAEKDTALDSYRRQWNATHKSRPIERSVRSFVTAPLIYAARRQQFSVRAVLFRRDDWRSICLTNTMDDGDPIVGVSGGYFKYYFQDESFPSFARDPYGVTARELFGLDSGDPIGSCFASLRLDPVMPTRESPDEVKRLNRLLWKSSVHDMEWNQTDETEIAAISHLQFRISEFKVSLMGNICSDLREAVQSDGDFVRVLEGMNWSKHS